MHVDRVFGLCKLLLVSSNYSSMPAVTATDLGTVSTEEQEGEAEAEKQHPK